MKKKDFIYTGLDADSLMTLFEELDNALTKIEDLLDITQNTRKALTTIQGASEIYNLKLRDIAQKYVDGDSTILNDEISTVISTWVVLEDTIELVTNTSIRIVE